ncbi:MAG: hypothetical protein ACI959_001426 [Limisphaerales bacterium]|jgi:hypothetical protein
MFYSKANSIIPALIILLSGLLLGSSCNETILPASPLHQSYFGLEPGAVREYMIDSIQYRETLSNDTSRWYVKEEIGEMYTDLEGKTAYSILRYKRRNESSSWVFDNTWTARITDNQAEWVENNLRYIKLTFPPNFGKRWKGHIHLGGLSSVPVSESCNNLSLLEDWDFEYTEVHSPFILGDFQFDSTVTVLQQGQQNLIEFNESIEVYAKGVGLVERQFYHYTTQEICPSCPWNEKVACGYSVMVQLLNYQ